MAALKQRIQHGAASPGPDGITPLNLVALLRESASSLSDDPIGLLSPVSTRTFLSPPSRYQAYIGMTYSRP